MTDYYRLKIENGIFNMSIFDKGNPIPHTKHKGKITSELTQDFIKDAYNKVEDPYVKKALNSFIKMSNDFHKKINKDFE